MVTMIWGFVSVDSGGILGHFGTILGHPGAVLSPSWVVLGLSWAILGPSGCYLGAILDPSWGVLGASWGVLGHLEAVLDCLGAARVALGGFEASWAVLRQFCCNFGVRFGAQSFIFF